MTHITLLLSFPSIQVFTVTISAMHSALPQCIRNRVWHGNVGLLIYMTVPTEQWVIRYEAHLFGFIISLICSVLYGKIGEGPGLDSGAVWVLRLALAMMKAFTSSDDVHNFPYLMSSDKITSFLSDFSSFLLFPMSSNKHCTKTLKKPIHIFLNCRVRTYARKPHRSPDIYFESA